MKDAEGKNDTLLTTLQQLCTGLNSLLANEPGVALYDSISGVSGLIVGVPGRSEAQDDGDELLTIRQQSSARHKVWKTL